MHLRRNAVRHRRMLLPSCWWGGRGSSLGVGSGESGTGMTEGERARGGKRNEGFVRDGS